MQPGGRHHRTHRRHAEQRIGRSQRYAVVLLGALVVSVGAVTMVGSAQPWAGSPQPAERPDSGPHQVTRFPEEPVRAFAADSWWNTEVPDDAPLHPYDVEILDYLRTAKESGRGCLMLAGAGNKWGQPIYWALPDDPVYDVVGVRYSRPPELSTLRIPRGAQAADNSDGSMSVYDLEKGYVVALTDAAYDEDEDAWRAKGATVTYLESNGLHVATGRSDDPRNTGTHRGNNGATMAVAWNEVRAGEIPHVLKVASGPEVADRFVFPMTGSDGDYRGDDPAVPAQGLRVRIKPSLDLETLDLDPDALVIARALQDYGFYIGDSSGTTSLKLEDTVSQRRGRLWDLPPDALCSLPFTSDHWDVLAEGYDPSR